MSQDTQQSEQLSSEYLEIWNERDYSRIPDVVSESFTGIPRSGEYHGQDGLEEWIDDITSAFPDFEVEVVDEVVEGGTIMSEVKYTMTHEGEFLGIPPTGETIEVRGMGKARVEDGKIEESRVYTDLREIAEKLGVEE